MTNVAGGERLHIKTRETVFHPGFYRVALAVNSRDELPKDPVATTWPSPTGPRSVSAAIQSPPQPPVLADGPFPHVSRFDKEQETDVDIPNINCAKLYATWPPTVLTRTATTLTTIALYCRSALMLRSRSTCVSPPRKSRLHLRGARSQRAVSRLSRHPFFRTTGRRQSADAARKVRAPRPV